MDDKIVKAVSNGLARLPAVHTNRGLAAGSFGAVGGFLGSFLGGPPGAALGIVIASNIGLSLADRLDRKSD